MHRLRHKAKAEGGRLLRVLLLRLGAVSTDSGPARRRAWRGAVLCLVGDEKPVIAFIRTRTTSLGSAEQASTNANEGSQFCPVARPTFMPHSSTILNEGSWL